MRYCETLGFVVVSGGGDGVLIFVIIVKLLLASGPTFFSCVFV